MTDNLFDTNTDAPFQADPNKNYRQELVGDGKKFKTDEDLARGKYEADQYIEILKKRSDELRADYLRVMEENKAKAKLEEMIAQLQNTQRQNSSDLPQVNTENNAKAISPEDVESLIDRRVKAISEEEKARNNFKIVQDKLKETFGSNYQSALTEQAEKLNLSIDDVNALARKSPEAFFRTMGLNQQQQDSFQAPPRSSQRTDNFSPRGKEKRTWAYYQELKKTNPKLYYDPKIAVQMHNDAIELGAAFEDGDFHAI